jgi:hypothetical protein
MPEFTAPQFTTTTSASPFSKNSKIEPTSPGQQKTSKPRWRSDPANS